MNIYITTQFKGRVGNGKGHYIIAGDEPVRGFEGDFENVSFPRFNALTCYTAAKNVPDGESLTLTVQDAYAAGMIDSGHCDGANKDVWDLFFKEIKKFTTFTVIRDKDHPLVGWRPTAPQ